MTRKHTVIAGAALVIAGTAGMASWLSVGASERVEQVSLAPVAATSGVSETEGLVATQPLAPQVSAPQDLPVAAAPVVRYVPAAAARVDAPRVERDTRTPVTASPAATPAPVQVERTEPVERLEAAAPVEPRFVEVHVPAGTVIGVRMTSGVTSENAEVEDRVEAIVTRDVVADGRVAIASGTRVLGSVNEVTRGGKFKERARLGIRFHTLVLADGSRETLRVDAIVREGDSPTRETAAKIGGGAVGGAIIGGIIGGRKGALLGGAAGAGAGTAAVVAGDRSVAAVASGTPLSIRLDAPVTLTIERE